MSRGGLKLTVSDGDDLKVKFMVIDDANTMTMSVSAENTLINKLNSVRANVRILFIMFFSH